MLSDGDLFPAFFRRFLGELVGLRKRVGLATYGQRRPVIGYGKLLWRQAIERSSSLSVSQIEELMRRYREGSLKPEEFKAALIAEPDRLLLKIPVDALYKQARAAAHMRNAIASMRRLRLSYAVMSAVLTQSYRNPKNPRAWKRLVAALSRSRPSESDFQAFVKRAKLSLPNSTSISG